MFFDLISPETVVTWLIDAFVFALFLYMYLKLKAKPSSPDKLLFQNAMGLMALSYLLPLGVAFINFFTLEDAIDNYTNTVMTFAVYLPSLVAMYFFFKLYKRYSGGAAS